ncbi:MAG TPA: bifunctional DNA primase/polymerase [Acidimicrobiales bacterium]|jgi:hypothetical protein|nr:bifunctional DNA primase/polymerase [Acidimicrobiales bacterium]
MNATPAPLLRAAIEYAEQGWRVLPLRPRGKVPATRHGVHDATTNTDQIRAWWAQRPDANIGLASGYGFDVLDIDGPAGIDSLIHLAKGRPLPEGPAVTTGRGQHRYFAPTGTGNRVAIRPGLDWRGRGGYVVAPPSIHPTGATYTWTTPTGPAQALPEVPRWVPRNVPHPRSTRQNGSRPVPCSTTPYGRTALTSETTHIAHTRPGTRNDTLVRAAFRIGQLIAAGHVDPTTATLELRAAATASGLGEREANATIASGLRGGYQHPRTRALQRH